MKNNGLGVTDMGEYRDILLGTLDDLTATTFAERLERFYAHNGYDKVSPSLRGEESAWEEKLIDICSRIEISIKRINFTRSF